MAKGSSMRAGYGKQSGGGSRWPSGGYSLVSSSSSKVEGKAGSLKVPRTLPYSGKKGGK